MMMVVVDAVGLMMMIIFKGSCTDPARSYMCSIYMMETGGEIISYRAVPPNLASEKMVKRCNSFYKAIMGLSMVIHMFAAGGCLYASIPCYEESQWWRHHSVWGRRNGVAFLLHPVSHAHEKPDQG